MKILLSSLAMLFIAGAADAAELTVGPGKMFAKPSLAAAACNDGDTILIDAGAYTGDTCVWLKSNLIIRGVGGMVVLDAAGNYTWGKGTWVLEYDNYTVENIQFSNAWVPGSSGNGAGIRLDGTNLTVRNCIFFHCQNGILTNNNQPTSDILIENCEFNDNGWDSSPSTHGMYIGTHRSFTIRNSYIHNSHVGHNVKSRCANNYVINNRIMDEATGDSSYCIDLPNGGLCYVIGNLIEQGPNSPNTGIISIGAENNTASVNKYYVVNNTIVNDLNRGTFISFGSAAAPTEALVMNNLYVGPGTFLNDPANVAVQSHNLLLPASTLVNAAGYDYHLAAGSPAIDAGADPGSVSGFNLKPNRQYVHSRDSEARATFGAAIDVGAYESGSAGTSQPEVAVTRSASGIADGSTDTISGTTIGGNTSLTYAIKNDGSADLSVGTPSVSGAVNCTVTVTTSPASSVAAGGSTTLVVTVNPTAATWSAAISFATNDTDEDPTNWTVSGTASTTSVPEIAVTRSAVGIADGSTDTISGTTIGVGTSLTYAIKNDGSAALSVGTPAISGAVNCTVSVTTSPASSVAGGGSTTLVVTVNPTAAAWTAGISIATNDSDENPTNWTVSGMASTTPVSEIAVTRGTAAIADGSTDSITNATLGANMVLTYAIKNEGTGALTLGTPVTSAATNCTVSVTTAPAASVAAGASTTLVLTVHPTAAPWSCAVSFVTNDTDEGPTNWTINGGSAGGETSGGTSSNGSSDGGGGCGAGSSVGLFLSLLFLGFQPLARWRRRNR